MSKEEIYKLLEQEKLKPKYIDIDEVGFSRWIEFNTKYQKCWIEWYQNVSTLRIGDRYGVRIPFTDMEINTYSPSNKRCLQFSHKDITKDFGLVDCDVDLTLEKLDWQEKKNIK